MSEELELGMDVGACIGSRGAAVKGQNVTSRGARGRELVVQMGRREKDSMPA